MKSFLTIPEVAKLLKVNRSTVLRWMRKGLVTGAQRVPGTKRWHIPLASYEALLKHHPYESREL